VYFRALDARQHSRDLSGPSLGIHIASILNNMRVRLVRKFADRIDGVDLRGHEVDEVFDVSPKEARLLMAEEWAIAERRSADLPHKTERRSSAHSPLTQQAADRG
jgi:hypothetical protein